MVKFYKGQDFIKIELTEQIGRDHPEIEHCFLRDFFLEILISLLLNYKHDLCEKLPFSNLMLVILCDGELQLKHYACLKTLRVFMV